MFNTLNSISALMLDGEVQRAEAMLRRLSDFLRATLALDALSDIPLNEKEADKFLIWITELTENSDDDLSGYFATINEVILLD